MYSWRLVNNHLILGRRLLEIPDRRMLINVLKSESRSSMKSRPYPLFIRFFAGHISARIALFYLGTGREVKFNLSICIRAGIKSIWLPRVLVSVCYYFFLNPEHSALHHPEAIRSVDILWKIIISVKVKLDVVKSFLSYNTCYGQTLFSSLLPFLFTFLSEIKFLHLCFC